MASCARRTSAACFSYYDPNQAAEHVRCAATELECASLRRAVATDRPDLLQVTSCAAF